ncbi:MAG: hypothetical protein KKB62_03635 [Nanoarchaeota archaeon]|nr:hypothetical protein [Nanoarchaeota archaeon]
MVKNILFVCRHNVFRSQIAQEFFKRLNKNKNYKAESAGLISYKKEDYKNNKNYKIEKSEAKKLGLRFNKKSKSLNSSLLKKTDILVVVANDIPISMFDNEVAFRGKIVLWKIPDIRKKDKNPRKVIRNSVLLIEKKVKEFVGGLK